MFLYQIQQRNVYFKGDYAEIEYKKKHIDKISQMIYILFRHQNVFHSLVLEDKIYYMLLIKGLFEKDARMMIPYYSQGFYEKYSLPDDILHVIVGEFTFGYTTKECSQLLKCI
jgi:hypothetical protein